jgi:hypothetical protein
LHVFRGMLDHANGFQEHDGGHRARQLGWSVRWRRPDVDAADAGGPETAPAVSAPTVPAGTVDCSAFPEEVIIEVALDYTRVRQLTPENLEFMQESLGLPDPAAFRTFADAFERLDSSGIETMQFDTPDTTVVGQGQLADRIEAALAARDERDEPDNPPWAALRAFVDENLTRQQLSTNYYMGEADCV